MPRRPIPDPTHVTIALLAYQSLLEGHRLRPDNDEIYQDMLKARAAWEAAWRDAHSR